MHLSAGPDRYSPPCVRDHSRSRPLASYSPFTIHHSPFTVHRSLFTIHHSLFTPKADTLLASPPSQLFVGEACAPAGRRPKTSRRIEMSRKILIAAVGIFALGVVVTPAAAQMTKPIGLSIRAGAVFPTDSSTRSAVGNTWLGFGAEYALGAMGMGMPGTNGHLSISADWFGKSSASVIPVLLNFVGTQNEFFYSA